MAGFVTPTHLLFLLVVLAVVLGLGRLTRGDAQAAAAARARRLRGRRPRWHLARPTQRQAHVAWLVASALVAFALTRAVALPLFLLVFLVLWACGYWVLVRLYG
jgi:hypothetical protein